MRLRGWPVTSASRTAISSSSRRYLPAAAVTSSAVPGHGGHARLGQPDPGVLERDPPLCRGEDGDRGPTRLRRHDGVHGRVHGVDRVHDRERGRQLAVRRRQVQLHRVGSGQVEHQQRSGDLVRHGRVEPAANEDHPPVEEPFVQPGRRAVARSQRLARAVSASGPAVPGTGRGAG